MKAALSVLVETVALVTVIGITQFLILVFRNPHQPSWLRTEFMESATATGFVAAFSFALAFEISGLVAAGANAFVAIALSVAATLGSGFAVWRIFEVGERLRRADAGESPFYPLRRRTPTLPTAPQPGT